MKRVLSLVILLVFLCGCTTQSTPDPQQQEPIQAKQTIKGVWIFYDELKNLGKLNSEEFEIEINKMFDNCVKYGLNSVFVQIRPFADSFYPSEIFPWSKYLTGKQGIGVDYDPLKIMIEAAHQRELSFHAWLNPFRISHKNDFNELSNDHPAHKMKDTSAVYSAENGIYFNPANLDSQKLILDGIKEIVRNYNVDGIHIDDYFYPSTDKNIDKFEYNEYKDNDGKLSLSKWRIEIINAFVSGMFNCVKGINPDVLVSISPAGNINNNYKELYADVKLWASEKGYCDIIIPQLYFGYENFILPFEKALNQWCEITDPSKVDLIIGLGAYKAENPQSEEWENLSVLIKQAEQAINNEIANGYCLFSYSSLLALEERADSVDNKSNGN